jgi:hypothetical protein
MGKKNAPVQRGVKNLLSGISLLMVSEGLDTGFSDLGLLVGFQRFRMLAFRGLDWFGFLWIRISFLADTKVQKTRPGEKLFRPACISARRMEDLPDERMNTHCPWWVFRLSIPF